MGTLIQGPWYVHILSLLTSTCNGTCTYYVHPLQVPRYVHVPASKQPLEVHAHTSRYVLGQNCITARSVQRYVHIPEQTYLIHKFIKFRGCLEAASEQTYQRTS